MDKDLIKEVKKKKQFSELPDSIVEKALVLNKGDVKSARAFLRKYFGVFLTNRVLKPKDVFDWRIILKTHISSKKRDYERLYDEILDDCYSVVDLGAGMNGFSVLEMHEASGVLEYWGVEASKQLVDLMNEFFDNYCKGYNAQAVWLDLFDLEGVKNIVRNSGEKRAILCFQVIDALESFEKDYSKKLILGVAEEMAARDIFVVSFPTKSLSGKKRFKASRDWMTYFLRDNFEIVKDFEMFDERFIVFKKN